MKIHSKTISRIAAVQVLYQYEFFNQQEDIETLIKKVDVFYKDEESIEELSKSKTTIKIKVNFSYFSSLVLEVLQNVSLIDEIIRNYLILPWKIENLPILLLSVLRVGICELKFFPDIPSKVSVNEFTGIASSMLEQKEISFVNSILDNMAKDNANQ